MTLLRTLALLALVGAAPLGARAAFFGPAPVPSPSPAASTAGDSGAADLGYAGSLPDETTSIFASGPVPVGDPKWSLRAFSFKGDAVEQPSADAFEEAPSRTPEPAGLFLLGTGAFATALSIRYRLFAL